MIPTKLKSHHYSKGVIGMAKRLGVGFLLWLLLIVPSGCSRQIVVTPGENNYQSKGVSIVNQGDFFSVTLDYSSGLTHREMGVVLAEGILKVVPDYESLVDSYITENLTKYEYPYAFYRMEDIETQINSEYYDEIAGMASVFSGGNKNVWNDKKISRDEFFLFNLFTDTLRGAQCSYISVFGSRSESGHTITARNLDWYGGSVNQLPRIQAIITYNYPDKKLCSIGYLGYLGVLTGFNDHKVFAGILDAGTNAPYSSEGRRSYPLDLRYALENNATMSGAAEYMRDPKKLYAYNHVIGFSDPDKSIILENNFSGNGTNNLRPRRMIRRSDSRLNKGVTWGMNDAIAAVNSFVLYGNHDNHKTNKYNTKRWNNIKKQLVGKETALSAGDLKEIASYNHGAPGVFSENGDIYNKMTLQMVIFRPDTLSLEVFFRPKAIRENPLNPKFQKIEVFTN